MAQNAEFMVLRSPPPTQLKMVILYSCRAIAMALFLECCLSFGHTSSLALGSKRPQCDEIDALHGSRVYSQSTAHRKTTWFDPRAKSSALFERNKLYALLPKCPSASH